MDEMTRKAAHSKMSPEFAARLRQVRPGARVRAIVLLHFGDSKTAPARRRQPAGDRRQKVLAFQHSGRGIVAEIDGILKRFGGQRLSPGVDALGCLPVETTPEGYRALLASGHTKAILEDQPVSVLQNES